VVELKSIRMKIKGLMLLAVLTAFMGCSKEKDELAPVSNNQTHNETISQTSERRGFILDGYYRVNYYSKSELETKFPGAKLTFAKDLSMTAAIFEGTTKGRWYMDTRTSVFFMQLEGEGFYEELSGFWKINYFSPYVIKLETKEKEIWLKKITSPEDDKVPN